MEKKFKRPRDPMQLAKLIGDIATGQIEETPLTDKERAASMAARKGGLKGGNARAKSMTAEQRSEVAKKAAKSRWEKGA